MNYMKARAVIPYEIMVFTQKEALLKFLAEKDAEILMTNDEELAAKAKELNIHKFLKLSEEQISDSIGESLEYHPIFKYQSTENIIREMLTYCTEGSICPMAQTANSFKGHVLGVYSPVGRCHKTMFSLALANVLGKKYRVLYLNLEEYTGLSEDLLIRQNGSLSEIMYMYRRNVAGLKLRVQNVIGHLGKFHYIPPVECPEDVVDILPEEWSTFCSYLMENLDYEFLVIDMGNLVKKPWYLLELMDVIFLPKVEDELGKNKLREFYQDMNNMGRGILLENVVTIDIPKDEELKEGILSMEQMEWSVVCSYARKVVHERGF